MEGDWELGRNPRKGGEERREVVARGEEGVWGVKACRTRKRNRDGIGKNWVSFRSGK